MPTEGLCFPNSGIFESRAPSNSTSLQSLYRLPPTNKLFYLSFEIICANFGIHGGLKGCLSRLIGFVPNCRLSQIDVITS